MREASCGMSLTHFVRTQVGRPTGARLSSVGVGMSFSGLDLRSPLTSAGEGLYCIASRLASEVTPVPVGKVIGSLAALGMEELESGYQTSPSLGTSSNTHERKSLVTVSSSTPIRIQIF